MTKSRLPVNATALKGAALLGVLAGIIAALIALTAAATIPSDTVVYDVVLPAPIDVQPTPVASAPPPTPETLPVTHTPPASEPLELAAAPAAPTTGIAESAPALRAARSQAAAPARMAGYRGGLQIDSDPDGARVFVDGEEVGLTPIHVKNLPVGSRVVRVEAAGYATWTTAARVVANQRARVSAVLQRSSQR